jgi:hypothetical protein
VFHLAAVECHSDTLCAAPSLDGQRMMIRQSAVVNYEVDAGSVGLEFLVSTVSPDAV